MISWIQLYNNWHNLLKQFPRILPANSTIILSLENIKRENNNFLKMQILWSGLFSSPRKPGFAYHAYIFPKVSMFA